jgi:hypothetical protein
MIEGLEEKIVTLRKHLHKKDTQQKNTKVLDEIICSQRKYHEKSVLGYNQTKKVSSSKTMEQIRYAETIIGYPNKEEGKRNQEEYYMDMTPTRRLSGNEIHFHTKPNRRVEEFNQECK